MVWFSQEQVPQLDLIYQIQPNKNPHSIRQGGYDSPELVAKRDCQRRQYSLSEDRIGGAYKILKFFHEFLGISASTRDDISHEHIIIGHVHLVSLFLKPAHLHHIH